MTEKDMKYCPMAVLGPGTVCVEGVPHTRLGVQIPPAEGDRPMSCRKWINAEEVRFRLVKPDCHGNTQRTVVFPARCMCCESAQEKVMVATLINGIARGKFEYFED